MQSHILQAKHNEDFIKSCTSSFPDLYFDWKVTATFYCALHLLHAFCKKRGVNPGRTHQDIKNSLDQRTRRQPPITPFPQHVWDWYSALQKYSEQARYDGILDPETENEVQKDNFIESTKLLIKLKTYFAKNGISSEDIAA